MAKDLRFSPGPWLESRDIQQFRSTPSSKRIPGRELNWHGLNPAFRSSVIRAFDTATALGLRPRFISGFRPGSYQAKLRRKYKSGDRKSVSAQPAKKSRHTPGVAVDMFIGDVTRVEVWVQVLRSNGLHMPIPEIDPYHVEPIPRSALAQRIWGEDPGIGDLGSKRLLNSERAARLLGLPPDVSLPQSVVDSAIANAALLKHLQILADRDASKNRTLEVVDSVPSRLEQWEIGHHWLIEPPGVPYDPWNDEPIIREPLSDPIMDERIPFDEDEWVPGFEPIPPDDVPP